MTPTDKTRDIQRWLAKQSPSARLRIIDDYARRMNMSPEEAADQLWRIESGEQAKELEQLEARIAELATDLREMQHLLHIAEDRPWMLALEMQFAGMRNLSLIGHAIGDDVGRGLALNQLALLKRAEAYSWTADTASAAWLAARTIPADSLVSLSTLPGSAGWWWFVEPLPIQIAPDQRLHAVLWAVTDDGIEFGAYALDKRFMPMLALSWTWPHGTSWQTMTDDMSAQRFLLIKRSDLSSQDGHLAIASVSRLFLAGCAWLGQRVVSITSGNIERHRRKQLQRETGFQLVSNEVRVIQLRRAEAVSSTASSDGEPVEWSCRWIVNGHWRNQYYASTSERKLIYIMPFVKGPSDKPLKVPQHVVYEVSR
jgi:hypothetical protein